jgi:hypothetical protein
VHAEVQRQSAAVVPGSGRGVPNRSDSRKFSFLKKITKKLLFICVRLSHGARTISKSLFASFSSEKEESFLSTAEL